MPLVRVRPARFRPILTTILVLVALFLIWLGIEIFFALTAKPNPTVDYGAKLMQHAAQWQGGDEADDVWDELIEAVELHQQLVNGLADEETGTLYSDLDWGYKALSGYDEIISDEVADKHWINNGYGSEAEARARVDMCRALSIESLDQWEESGILARLDIVAAGTRAVRPLPDTTKTQFVNVYLPELSEMRNLAYGLRAQMVVTRDAGDWEAYARAFEHAMALGRIATYQVTLIDRMVGHAIRRYVVGQVHEDVLAERLTSECLMQIEAAIQRQSRIPPMSYAFAGERSAELDMVQWVHDSRGRLIVSNISELGNGSGASILAITNIASIVFPRRDATEQWLNDLHDGLEDWYDLQPFQTRSKENPVEWMFEELESGWRHPVQQLIIPAFGKAVATSHQAYLNELGFRTLVALERYRLDRQGVPESLSDLVPEYLQELPIDPYADGVQPLQYKTGAVGVGDGRRYLLYSIGYDNTDDNGTPHEEPIEALWDDRGGTDYVINQSRD
jgi:hypothetical protein